MGRILVADDEQGVREFLAEALELDGHSVSQAEDGAAAIAALDKSAFDLVLTDLTMPGATGLDVLAHCRAHMPEVQVILITAHASVQTAVSAMRDGAFDYLEKPLSSPNELRALAKRALERRELVDHRERARSGKSIPRLSWRAESMKSVVQAIERLAPTSATALFLGESGTGKEVAARALHAMSGRADKPFVAVNCATLSPELLASELFGHERGAFTGAVARQRGKLELAEGGTFFLDEIGELRLDLQAKLLRVLEERTFERVGGTQTIEVDLRWVAATHRDLGEMIREGAFREDLYHRLAVFPIELPPLRERREDLEELAKTLLRRIAREQNRPTPSLSDGAVERIREADWPGNARQLRNALERAMILNPGSEIQAAEIWLDSNLSGASSDEGVINLAALEKQAIIRALERSGGNRKESAALLGIGLRTLYSKLKLYEID